MSNEAKYLIFLTEQYALFKGMSGADVMRLFEKYDMVEYIRDMYYSYHVEKVENAIADIDRELASLAAG